MATISLLIANIAYFAAVCVHFVWFYLRKKSRNWYALGLTLLGFASHSTFHFFRAVEKAVNPYTIAYSLNNIAWVIVLAFLLSQIRRRIDLLGIFVLPIPIVLLVFPIVLRPDANPVVYDNRGTVLTLHMVFTLLSYAVFALAFVLSITYLVVRRGLKSKNMTLMQYPLPSLQTLDQVGHTMVLVGFPLITMGLVMGAVLWSQNMDLPSKGDLVTKELLASLTWLVYGSLIAGRRFMHISARRSAYISVLGFIVVLITLFGTQHRFGQ